MSVLGDDQRTYPHGVPSWVETGQPDPAAAAEFYAGLFGWELTDMMPPEAPGSYLIATLDGHAVAAVSSAEGPARWHTYIACADADATAAAVSDAGGRVLTPVEVAGPAGRWAECADPGGAVFRLWEAGRRLGAQLANVPGAWNFSDLVCPDPQRVLGFYREVFGWEVSADLGAGMIRLPGYGDHLQATVDPGIYERQAFAPPGFADVVAGLATDPRRCEWEVLFTVADRDASAAAAEHLGATLVSSVDTEWTREAVIRDPQGAELTLSQFTPPV